MNEERKRPPWWGFNAVTQHVYGPKLPADTAGAAQSREWRDAWNQWRAKRRQHRE